MAWKWRKASLKEGKALAVQEFERSHMIRLLRTYDGNISEAARTANKYRRAFWELMRKYKVRVEDVCATPHKGPDRETQPATMTPRRLRNRRREFPAFVHHAEGVFKDHHFRASYANRTFKRRLFQYPLPVSIVAKDICQIRTECRKEFFQ
jgi:hypothetical protein